MITATRQHQTVGMLNSPLSIRLWLSRGKPDSYRHFLSLHKIVLRRIKYQGNEILPAPIISLFSVLSDVLTEFAGLFRLSILRTLDRFESYDKYGKVEGFQRLPLESSISALKAIALPRHLLDLAVMVFLVGFGLYVLSLWSYGVENSGERYRNVFVVFIVTVGVYTIYDLLVQLARVLIDDKRNEEFSIKKLGGFRRPGKLLELEKSLAEVQQRIRSEHPSEQGLQEMQAQLQQGLEGLLGTENPTLATTNTQFTNTDDRNISSPLRTPARVPATAKPPTLTPDYHSPSPLTNQSNSTGYKVDKYQAWQHYLIGYMRTQPVSNDQSLLLKIMEMKGSFEAEWDRSAADARQETAYNDPESIRHQSSIQVQNQDPGTEQVSIHDNTKHKTIAQPKISV